MKVIMVIIGLFAALFLVPIFKNLYDAAVLPMTVDIDNTFLRAFFISVPYLVPVAIGILAFLTLRRRNP